MPRYLLVGDPHFQVKNLSDVDIFISEVKKLLNERKDIDTIVVLGDLLHNHQQLNVFPYNKALGFIKMLSEFHKVFSIVGNHDAYCNSIFLTDQHWQNAMKEWKNVKIVDDVTIDGDVILIPYVPDGRFIEALDLRLKNDWMKKKCIFAHQTISGAKMGAIIAENKDVWKKEYPRVISGHLHDKQHLCDGKVYYTGSSMQHNFGETADKSLCIYDTEKDTIEEVFLKLPTRKIVNISEENIKEISKQLEKIKSTTTHVKIQIHGSNEFFNTFKKSTQYKDLVNKEYKIIYKPLKNNIEIKNETKKVDFKEILYELVKNNEDMKMIYKDMFGGEIKKPKIEEVELEIIEID